MCCANIILTGVLDIGLANSDTESLVDFRGVLSGALLLWCDYRMVRFV